MVHAASLTVRRVQGGPSQMPVDKISSQPDGAGSGNHSQGRRRLFSVTSMLRALSRTGSSMVAPPPNAAEP